MRSRRLLFGGICLASLLLVVAYNILDNRRVVLVEQQVVIEDLPEEFEGFRILQISDLHGKTFGQAQQPLLALINRTEYDMLAISGDMSDGYTGDPDNRPFYDLLDGIQDKEHAFYATGNTGPWAVESYTGALTGEGKELETRGVHSLNHPYSIQRDESRLWVGDFWLTDLIELYEIGFSDQMLADPALTPEDRVLYENMKQYGQGLIAELEEIAPEDLLIGVTHCPFSIDSGSDMPNINPWYDLVLAGHYHGGQIRVPLLGAIYIPDGASETRGFFPPQDEVSGLKDWGSFQQYISRGLGASNSVGFLNFRLFNTPEINLITLTGG